jgi:hypothetical protein
MWEETKKKQKKQKKQTNPLTMEVVGLNWQLKKGIGSWGHNASKKKNESKRGWQK